MRLLVLAVVFSAAGLSACGDSKEITERRGFISQGMRDPESTQFRNETLHKSGWLCGEVNSKNAYGAYVGFERFMAKDAASAYTEGSGRVGSSPLQHQALLSDMDIEAKALKESIDLMKTGGAPTDASVERVRRRSFELRWQEYCH